MKRRWISHAVLPKLSLVFGAAFSWKTALSAAAVAGLLLGAGLAHAEPPAAEESGAKKTRVLRFGDLMIEGSGKSPQVYYLLNRKRIDLGHKPMEQELLSPIKTSVRNKPF